MIVVKITYSQFHLTALTVANLKHNFAIQSMWNIKASLGYLISWYIILSTELNRFLECLMLTYFFGDPNSPKALNTFLNKPWLKFGSSTFSKVFTVCFRSFFSFDSVGKLIFKFSFFLFFNYIIETCVEITLKSGLFILRMLWLSVGVQCTVPLCTWSATRMEIYL